jgi:RecA-family ATPase
MNKSSPVFLENPTTGPQTQAGVSIPRPATIPTPQTTPTPKTVTATELITADVEAVEFALPGLMPVGLSLFLGAPKTGKTLVELQMASVIASKGNFLDSYAGTGGDVLCIILEDGPSRIRQRMAMMIKEYPATDKVKIATTWGVPGQKNVSILDTWLTDHPETKAVFIDTFVKFFGPGMRRGYHSEYMAAARLKDVADHHGVSIVLIHHTIKKVPEDWLMALYGSSGLTGAADSIMFLDRERGADQAIFHATGRDIDDISVAIRLDRQSCVWHVEGDAEIIKLNAERREIYDILVNAESPIQLAEIATSYGKSTTTVSNLLAKLVDAGVVRRVSHGVYEAMKSSS